MVEASKTDSVAPREMISFQVCGQEFCVDVMSVREIRGWTPATPIAHAPDFVRGVINLRGKVLPIVDLAVRLGFAPTEATTRHAILVVHVGDQALGLLVEGVSEILTITHDLIQPTPDVVSDSARLYVSGIIALEQRMIGLIALAALVQPANVQAAA